jgi:hypothetical protein
MLIRSRAGLRTWPAADVAEELAQRISGPVGEYFLFTAAAQVTTLPVILYIFGRCRSARRLPTR